LNLLFQFTIGFIRKSSKTSRHKVFVNNHLISQKINCYFLEIRKKGILLQSRLLSLVIRSTANKEWIIVDADGQILGRMASKVAKILRGKNKSNFTPHADCGDNVIVINAEKVALTGKK
jgi:hypothetical protein